jgi:hypothetical protein
MAVLRRPAPRARCRSASAVHRVGRRHHGGRAGGRRHRLGRQPGDHGADVGRIHAPGDLGHAVRRVGAALLRLPGTELGVQVVARQAQQARDVWRHAGQPCAVALRTGRHAARRIALARQHLAAAQQRGRGSDGRRRRVGQLKRRKMPSDLQQVSVAERVHHARHQAVVAPPVAEVEQLVIEVARRLAGQAGVVAVGPGAALVAMAGGAGQHALGHAVFEARGSASAAAQEPD